MAYYGSNDDRGEADQLHRHNVDTMTRFLQWLLDRGRKVRLYTTDQEDQPILLAMRGDVRAQRTDDSDIEAKQVSTLPEFMRRMALVDTVVGSRYHNVLCALKLSKANPVRRLCGQARRAKCGKLAGDFCEPARSVDLDRLIWRFELLERDRDRVVTTLDERNAEKVRLLDGQFAVLSPVVACAPPGGRCARQRLMPRARLGSHLRPST